MTAAGPSPTRRRLLFLAPLLAFAALAALFLLRIGNGDNPATLPSALIGKPVPEFTLQPLAGSGKDGIASADLRQGRVTLVNVWASWCIPCREEHPFLMALAKRGDVELYGINNKDGSENARRFLGQFGDPFKRIGADTTGRISIDWGVYGVPETFIVDGKGTIRLRHVGPLNPQIIDTIILPAIEAARKS